MEDSGSSTIIPLSESLKIIKRYKGEATGEIFTKPEFYNTISMRLLFPSSEHFSVRERYPSRGTVEKSKDITTKEMLRKEFPEIVKLSEKLKKHEKLIESDKWNLNETCKGAGWDEEDIREELMNLDEDPTEREERYKELFRKYYESSKRLKKDGDDVQAAEKLWGAITALIKAYVSGKGVFVAHWSRRDIDNVVENNVEKDLRDIFGDLITYGSELHEHFYERGLPLGKFNRRWKQCIELIEKVLRKIKWKDEEN